MEKLVEKFGLDKFYDYVGYNVLEMDYDDYKANIHAVGAFLLASDKNLKAVAIDDFGDEVKNWDDANAKNVRIIIYDPEYWRENGII